MRTRVLLSSIIILIVAFILNLGGSAQAISHEQKVLFDAYKSAVKAGDPAKIKAAWNALVNGVEYFDLAIVMSVGGPAQPVANPKPFIDAYRSAVESGNIDRVKAAWKGLVKNVNYFDAIQQLRNTSKEAAGHFVRRTMTERFNVEQRAGELMGELRPYSELEGRMVDAVNREPAISIEGDSDLAGLVKKTKQYEAGYKAKTKMHVQENRPPSSSEPPPGSLEKTQIAGDQQGAQRGEDLARSHGSQQKSLSKKEFALKTTAKALDVVGAAGLAASGIRKESEEAAKEGREFSSFKALENVGHTVIKGTAVDPYERGKRIAHEEINRMPGYERDVRAKLKKDGWSPEQIDAWAPIIARENSKLYAVERTFKEIFYENPGKLSQKILEEEALKELEAARVAGEGSTLSTWRTAKYKGRAVYRVLGELTLMNPLMDAVTYDSDADRRAAAMERKLQNFYKTRLLEGLTKTTRLRDEIAHLMATGDLNDSSVQERLNRLHKEYDASFVKVTRVNESLLNKMDPSDPSLVTLQYAVAQIPREPIPEDTGKKKVKPSDEADAKISRDTKHPEIISPDTRSTLNETDKKIEDAEKVETDIPVVDVSQKDEEIIEMDSEPELDTHVQKTSPETLVVDEIASGTSDDTAYCPENEDELKAMCAKVNEYIGKYESQGQAAEWTAAVQRAFLFRAQCCGYRWTTDGPSQPVGDASETDQADKGLMDSGEGDMELLGISTKKKGRESSDAADDGSWFDDYKEELQEHRIKKYRAQEQAQEKQRQQQQQVTHDPEWDMIMQQGMQNFGNAVKGLSGAVGKGPSGSHSQESSPGSGQQPGLQYMHKDPHKQYRTYQTDTVKKKATDQSSGGSYSLPDSGSAVELLGVEAPPDSGE